MLTRERVHTARRRAVCAGFVRFVRPQLVGAAESAQCYAILSPGWPVLWSTKLCTVEGARAETAKLAG